MEILSNMLSWIESLLQKVLDMLGIKINVRYLLYGIVICCIVCCITYLKMATAGV